METEPTSSIEVSQSSSPLMKLDEESESNNVQQSSDNDPQTLKQKIHQIRLHFRSQVSALKLSLPCRPRDLSPEERASFQQARKQLVEERDALLEPLLVTKQAISKQENTPVPSFPSQQVDEASPKSPTNSDRVEVSVDDEFESIQAIQQDFRSKMTYLKETGLDRSSEEFKEARHALVEERNSRLRAFRAGGQQHVKSARGNGTGRSRAEVIFPLTPSL